MEEERTGEHSAGQKEECQYRHPEYTVGGTSRGRAARAQERTDAAATASWLIHRMLCLLQPASHSLCQRAGANMKSKRLLTFFR